MQLSLLGHRRFAPLFWTQFFGAFNDNLLKNALAILVAYRALHLGGLAAEGVIALSAGLFVLPFFLFSAVAGQLADKLSKTTLLRAVKVAEVVIMLVAVAGFASESLPLLLASLFLMGTHSAVFGPAKYGVLPELVGPAELVGANALVETGTFVAILLGTVLAGALMALGGRGVGLTCAVLLAVALLGFVASRRLPRVEPADPGLTVTSSPVAAAADTLRAVRQERAVLLAVLGLSWFWFLGASFVTMLPTWVKDDLGGGEPVLTLLLALFCVGIAVGSLLCERVGGERIELGLVPVGAAGMTVGAAGLAWAGAARSGAAVAGVRAFLTSGPGGVIAAAVFVLAVAGGLFTVPLYAVIQARSTPASRSRVVAGNNVLNAAFMVASAGLLVGAHALGLSHAQVFGALAVLNTLVALYVFALLPEFMLRLVALALGRLAYRVRVEGAAHIPAHGPALLVANHVSFVDWLFVTMAAPRPVRFIMYKAYFDMPLLGWLFRAGRAIPIAGAKEDPDALARALDEVAQALAAGELVCLFPEGELTRDGLLGAFRPGLERVVARTPVPVVPLAITGMWGSFFSRKDGLAFRRPFRRVLSRVRMVIGEVVEPTAASAAALEATVASLGALGRRCGAATGGA